MESDTVKETMASVSYRSDTVSDEALRFLEQRCGLNRSEAIREALIDFAELRRREALLAEVALQAGDEADQPVTVTRGVFGLGRSC